MENFLGRYNDRGFSECDFAGTFLGPDCDGGHRADNGEESVKGHQDKSVDGDIGRHVDYVLHAPTPDSDHDVLVLEQACKSISNKFYGQKSIW